MITQLTETKLCPKISPQTAVRSSADKDGNLRISSEEENQIFVEIVGTDSARTEVVEQEVVVRDSNQSAIVLGVAKSVTSSGDRENSHASESSSNNSVTAQQSNVSKADLKSGLVKEKDFTFVLRQVPKVGRSFSHAREWYCCFHCAYKSRERTALIKHMDSSHSEMYELHKAVDVLDCGAFGGVNQEGVGENRKVMKMSVFEKLYCRKGPHSLEKKSAATNSDKAAQGKEVTLFTGFGAACCTVIMLFSSVVSCWRSVFAGGKRNRGVEKQDLPGVFSCQTCSKTFGRLRYLRKHVATHRTERKFLCDECGKGFTTKTYVSSCKIEQRITHRMSAKRRMLAPIACCCVFVFGVLSRRVFFSDI